MRLFADAGDRMTGDITPTYATMDSEDVAYVRTLVPGARIIYLLRDPIERFWSELLLHCRNYVGGDAFRVTEEVARRVLLDSPDEIEHVWKSGMYLENLARWEEHFSPEQIHVGFYDDLADDPDHHLATILQFLDLPQWRPADGRLTKRFNRRKVDIDVPSDLETDIAHRYLGELHRIHDRFGGPTTAWLRRAEEAAARKEAAEPVRMGVVREGVK